MASAKKKAYKKSNKKSTKKEEKNDSRKESEISLSIGDNEIVEDKLKEIKTKENVVESIKTQVNVDKVQSNIAKNVINHKNPSAPYIDKVNIDMKRAQTDKGKVILGKQTNVIVKKSNYADSLLGGKKISQNLKASQNNETITTNSQKWWFSLLVGLLFIIFACSIAYQFTNAISTSLSGPATFNNGGSTWFGLIIHGILFFLLIRLILF